MSELNDKTPRLFIDDEAVAKRNALPKEPFQVGALMYKAAEGGSGLTAA